MDDPYSHLTILSTPDGYSAHFMDAGLWTPVIQSLSRKYGIPNPQIRAGTAGTYPTFILDRSYVIKFFGPLFGGGISYQVEYAVNSLLSSCPQVPAACLLHSGQIMAGNTLWQYLIFDYIPGRSYREDYEKIVSSNRQIIASRLGETLRALHNLSIPKQFQPLFPTDTQAYRRKLHGWFKSRLHCSQPESPFALGLPPVLADQAEQYLQTLYGEQHAEAPLHLIHADMTRDHVLGEIIQSQWQINGLIDFGDCMNGDLYYELAPLQLDFFDCDRDLLSKFLSAYGEPDIPPILFARFCLAAALQHQFNVFSGIFERHPEFTRIDNLEQLAKTIWLPG